MPPERGIASYMTGLWPARPRNHAAVRPAGPAPTIAIFLPVGGSQTGEPSYTPGWSVTKRLIALMPTAESTSTRRQTTSHLRTHTRPQIAGSGFVSRMRSTACR